jgi:hypothetical protein
MTTLVKEEYLVFNYVVEEMFYFHQSNAKRWPACVELPEPLFGKLVKQNFPALAFVSHVEINAVPVFPVKQAYPSFIDEYGIRHFI